MDTVSLYFNSEILEVVSLYLFGGVRFLDLLALLMAIDIATGLMKAWQLKDLRSRTSYYGFARKIGVFGIVIVANIIDSMLDLNGTVTTVTVLFYMGNEILSITENAAKLGLKVPPIIQEKLRGFDKYGEKNKEDK